MAVHRVSLHRRWLLRDIPRTAVLLAWLVAGIVALIVLIDWHAIRRSALQNASPTAATIDQQQLRSGSIIVAPMEGDQCWQRTLDNRTGQMWDNGYVSCEKTLTPSRIDPSVNMSAARLNAIGKSFRSDRGN